MEKRLCSGAVCPASAACGIGSLDSGAERCFKRILLDADIVFLCLLHRAARFPKICAGSFFIHHGLNEQADGGNVAGGDDFAGLLAVEATYVEAGQCAFMAVEGKAPFLFYPLFFRFAAYLAQYNPTAINYPLGSRINNALVSFVTYLAKTFWPRELAVFYPFLFRFPYGNFWSHYADSYLSAFL